MNQRAFATIMALVLIALVAAALSTMAIGMRMEGIRTQNVRSKAVLEQLLLAGAADASFRAKSWPEKPVETRWSIKLPAELTTGGGTLNGRLQIISADQASAQIIAKIGANSAIQKISFQRRDDGTWAAIGTRLNSLANLNRK